MPKVSVIINCHNSEKYLEETIESVNNQTFQDFEIVLWDNASTDRTAVIAKENAMNMRYYYSHTLVPLGNARNKAIEHSVGEYICFIDSDDLWEPNKLERELAVIEKSKDIGLVMTNFRTMNMFSGQISEKKERPDKLYTFEEFIKQYAFCLSTCMIRRSIINDMPMWFDERFNYAEEYDFFSRLVYNCKAYYIGTPLAIRRMHEGMSTIKLAPRIPIEHQMTLDNLRNYIPNFDKDYPDVVTKIEYVRDYMDAKQLFPQGNLLKIRALVKPYIFKEKRAMAYYLMAHLPKNIAIKAFKKIYHNSI